MMNKYAYYQGQVDALMKLGFAPEAVYTMLVSHGIDKTAAEAMIKEAIPFLGAIGRGIGSLFAKAAPAVGNLASKAVVAGGSKGVQGAAGGFAGKALGGLSRGMQEFAANPGMAVKGFGKNFGSALFTGQGTGIGGTLGRGTQYAGTASTVKGMFGGGGGQPQQQQMMQPAY